MVKIKLVENINVIIPKENIEIFDKIKIVESEGKQFNCKGILKNVPVTKYTENLNERIYSKSLWENIQKIGSFEGAYCFADHAEEDGSVKDVCAIWKNFSVKESECTADLYCVGELGQNLLDIASLSKTGFSTTGFGEFLEESKEVDPDTFEFCSCDWVINPSQVVYATSENIDINKESSIEKINTNKYMQENKEVNIMDKTQKANLKNQVRIALKEAKVNENFDEAIKDLKEISAIVPEEMTDTHTKISETMDVIINSQKEKTNLTESSLSEKAIELETVKTELKTTNNAFTEITEKCKKLEGILEVAGISENNDVSILKENTEKMEKDIEIFEKDYAIMGKDIILFEEDSVAMEKDLNLYEEDCVAMENDIKILLEDKRVMETNIMKTEKKIKLAEKHIEELETLLTETYDYNFDNHDSNHNNNRIAVTNRSVNRSINRTRRNNSNVNSRIREKNNGKYVFRSNIDEDEKTIISEKTRKTSGSRNRINNDKVKPEIRDFYETVEKENPGLRDVKKEILSSKSLMEATKTVQSFIGDGTDKVIIKENLTNMEKPIWLQNRM